MDWNFRTLFSLTSKPVPLKTGFITMWNWKQYEMSLKSLPHVPRLEISLCHDQVTQSFWLNDLFLAYGSHCIPGFMWEWRGFFFFGLVATNIIVFIPHEQESKVVQPQVSWHNAFLKYFVAFFSFKRTLVLYYLWGLSTDYNLLTQHPPTKHTHTETDFTYSWQMFVCHK